VEQLVALLSRRRPAAYGPLGMKEKQAREVNSEEGPTLSKTKTERVGHPRGFSAASMRHPPVNRRHQRLIAHSWLTGDRQTARIGS
jgi:hypothetical protein